MRAVAVILWPAVLACAESGTPSEQLSMSSGPTTGPVSPATAPATFTSDVPQDSNPVGEPAAVANGGVSMNGGAPSPPPSTGGAAPSGVGGLQAAGGAGLAVMGGANGGVDPSPTAEGPAGPVAPADPSSMGGVSGSGNEQTGGAAALGSSGASALAGAPNDAGAGGSGDGVARPARVLLYSYSTLEIPSVPEQLAIFGRTLEDWQFEVEASEDPAVFNEENLTRYAAVGMINTCFAPFGQNQSGEAESLALQSFLQAGGGLFGTHCADVTFQSQNPPHLYNELLGGRASSQNFEGSSRCRKLEDHPTTAGLPDEFTYDGNLDGTDFVAEDSLVLVSCAWDGGAGMEVPVSWVRNEGAGRVFFTNFGKVDIDLTNETIGEAHILEGLSWVLGR